MVPFFSIISVVRNDAWSLTKSIRSLFRQTFRDFEYIVVDGASSDGTHGLIDFWRVHGLISQAVSEPDSGVYNAMNKGARLARGEFVCFLNAGDVYAHDQVLARVHQALSDSSVDGVLGWGELNGQIWGSWIESEAFKLASLGFCHQAMFIKRSLLLDHPFDERPFKTDSDTLQLARLYASNARIPIIQEVLAVRGGEPGLSADLERTRASIVNTLVEEYPELTEASADHIVSFRRQCAEPEKMCSLMDRSTEPLRSHLAYMTLDTLFLRQSARLADTEVERLFDRAREAITVGEPEGAAPVIDRFLDAQANRQALLDGYTGTSKALKAEIATFGSQEKARIARLRAADGGNRRAPADFIVSLTSFPARISTLHYVIQSLVEQTCPPREIHLWLGADEIPRRDWLPRALLEFEQQGLQVHFVRRTFHQYDKFMHNSGLNKDTPFVIVDDDVIYPPHSMESLLETHKAHPDAVVANRCHLMGISSDGTIGPYSDWKREFRVTRPSLRVIPTGAGGVLYPRGFLDHPMVTNVGDVLACAPYADDLWLKMCALARRIPTMSTPLSQGADWYLRYTPTMKAGALHATNADLGLNDLQVQRCMEWLSRIRPAWRQELLADPVE